MKKRFTFRAGNGTQPPRDPLPKAVHEYLTTGAAEGQRNERLYWAAQQFFAAGLPQDEAEFKLVPRALADGLKEVEARQAIRSAFRSTKVNEPIGKGPDKPRATAAPKRDLGFLDALRAAFLPGETIAVVEARMNEDGEWKPSVATFKPLEKWDSWIAKQKDINRLFESTDGGAFLAINPYRPGTDQRTNDNVSAFRHVLAEWDSLTTQEQYDKLIASGLPLSVIISSGGKSIHGWVRVDAPNKEEWERRRDAVHAALGCDGKNKDLARLSRCPGARRGDGVQKVLGVSVGAKSWDDWERTSDTGKKSGAWPAILSLADLAKLNPQPTDELIKGVLNKGCKMMIAGPSKARKSWVLIDLAMSCGMGKKWVGMDTRQCRTLFLNFELHNWMLWDRIQKVAKSRGWPDIDTKFKGGFDSLNLRGLTTDIVTMAGKLKDAVKGYDLIILDPIYKALGERDENAAGDIASLCNCLEDVCQASGAALVFAHHFAKGNSSEKATLDRMSGSGVWARDPDALIMLTPPATPAPVRGKKAEPPNYDMDMEFVLRAHAPMPAKQLTWQGGHFSDGSTPRFVVRHRQGSYADQYGDLLRGMPPLDRAAAEEWLRIEAEVDIEEAQKIFASLKRDTYGILDYDPDTGLWSGAATPF